MVRCSISDATVTKAGVQLRQANVLDGEGVNVVQNMPYHVTLPIYFHCCAAAGAWCVGPAAQGVGNTGNLLQLCISSFVADDAGDRCGVEAVVVCITPRILRGPQRRSDGDSRVGFTSPRLARSNLFRRCWPIPASSSTSAQPHAAREHLVPTRLERRESDS